MDVYIGLGLLSAGIVVLAFMILDSWLKNRNLRLAELSGLRDKTIEETEFTVSVDRNELQEDIIEEVSASRPVSQQTKLSDESGPSFKTKCSERITSPAKSQTTSVLPAQLLVLSVMAKQGTRFESYDLLQAISASGLQFGEMNIFHYYQTTPVGKMTLFSLASANKPGEFDLNNIAEFSCSGLMLFMDIGQVPDPQFAFKMMLDTAERLAEDLDAGLCADPMTPWNEKLAWQYHQKIMQYKTISKHG